MNLAKHLDIACHLPIGEEANGGIGRKFKARGRLAQPLANMLNAAA
jgi:hypothetical protein